MIALIYQISTRKGPSCEAAALTAELLFVAFLTPETMDEVTQVLHLTDAQLDPDSWVPNWFLSLGDPTSICLSGWDVFFNALQKALQRDAALAECPDLPFAQEAMDLLQAAVGTAEKLDLVEIRWEQAVGQRLVKDQLRHGFELLSQARHVEMPLVSRH